MDLKDQDELNLFTGVGYGECRGEPLEGKIAFACVVRNRVEDHRWPDTYKDVLLQPKQFSCTNEYDSNLSEVKRACMPSKMMYNQAWKECRFAVFGAYCEYYRDITNGCNHYHAACSEKDKPFWAENRHPDYKAGNHWFYRL